VERPFKAAMPAFVPAFREDARKNAGAQRAQTFPVNFVFDFEA
jgi:hypothetical protein